MLRYAMKTPLFHIGFTLVYFLTLRPGNRKNVFIFKVTILVLFIVKLQSRLGKGQQICTTTQKTPEAQGKLGNSNYIETV